MNKLPNNGMPDKGSPQRDILPATEFTAAPALALRAGPLHLHPVSYQQNPALLGKPRLVSVV